MQPPSLSRRKWCWTSKNNSVCLRGPSLPTWNSQLLPGLLFATRKEYLFTSFIDIFIIFHVLFRKDLKDDLQNFLADKVEARPWTLAAWQLLWWRRSTGTRIAQSSYVAISFSSFTLLTIRIATFASGRNMLHDRTLPTAPAMSMTSKGRKPSTCDGTADRSWRRFRMPVFYSWTMPLSARTWPKLFSSTSCSKVPNSCPHHSTCTLSCVLSFIDLLRWTYSCGTVDYHACGIVDYRLKDRDPKMLVAGCPCPACSCKEASDPINNSGISSLGRFLWLNIACSACVCCRTCPARSPH